jgi:hypothetical protein
MVLPGLPADFGKLIEDDTFARPCPSWVIHVGSGLSAFGALKTSGIVQKEATDRLRGVLATLSVALPPTSTET